MPLTGTPQKITVGHSSVSEWVWQIGWGFSMQNPSEWHHLIHGAIKHLDTEWAQRSACLQF